MDGFDFSSYILYRIQPTIIPRYTHIYIEPEMHVNINLKNGKLSTESRISVLYQTGRYVIGFNSFQYVALVPEGQQLHRFLLQIPAISLDLQHAVQIEALQILDLWDCQA